MTSTLLPDQQTVGAELKQTTTTMAALLPGNPAPFAVAQILFSLIILVSNVFALVIIVRSNLAQTRPSVFVLHLIVCDSYRGLLAFVIGVITLVDVQRHGYMDYETCRTVGFFTFSSITMGMYAVPLLLYDRLIFISSPVNYTHRMGKKLVAFLIIFNFLQALLIGVIPLNGWGRYEFHAEFASCTLQWVDSEGFPALVVIWVHFIPMMCSALCFSRIVFWMRKRICKVRINSNQIKLNWNMMSDSSFKEANLPMQLIGKTLSFILATYYFSWVPYFIFIIIAIAGVSISVSSDAIFALVSILTVITCAVNPWLYWLTSQRFRRSAIGMLPCSVQGSYTETQVSSLPPARSRSESMFVLNNYPIGANPAAPGTSC